MAENSAYLLAALAALTIGAGAAAAEQIKGPPVSERGAGLAVRLWTPGAAPSPDRKLRFVSVPKFFNKGKIQLSNGAAVVDAKDWRAVAMAADTGNGPCTLTLVGPRVALLAAHCVDAGAPPNAPGLSTIPGEVVFSQHSYDLRCEMSPGYRRSPVNPMGAPRSTDDFALCDVERRHSDRSALDEVAPESIATGVMLSTGVQIQMMGYGCTNLGISDEGRYTYDRADGTLNMGHERVDLADVSIYPGVAGIYARALSADGGPVLCPGDSGGPVMVAASAGPGRRVVAVNSALGATSDASATRPSFYSYFAPLGSAAFQSFAKDWTEQRTVVPPAQRKDRRICGVNIAPGVGGCRQ